MHFLVVLLSFLLNITSERSTDDNDNTNHHTERQKTFTRVLADRGSVARSLHYSEPIHHSVLTVINATTGISSLIFDAGGGTVGRIAYNAHLWSRCCRIEINEKNSSSAFLCDGEIVIEGLRILTCYSVGSIIERSGGEECRSTVCSSSSAEIRRSQLEDMEICSTEGGGVISGGGMRRESIIGCLFMNVSIGEREGGEENRRRRRIEKEERDMRGSKIERVEGGVYGVMGEVGESLS